MDDVNDEPTFSEVPEAVLRAANPFPADSTVVSVGRAVQPSQLADEIEAEVGYGVQLMAISLQPGTEVTPEAPGRLYVTPPVPEDALRRVIERHEIDELYGFSEEEREKYELLRKLHRGEDLTPEELRRALMHALS